MVRCHDLFHNVIIALIVIPKSYKIETSCLELRLLEVITCMGQSVFLLTLARWPMASEHCQRTSDFLSYWPGLTSGISTIVEN